MVGDFLCPWTRARLCVFTVKKERKEMKKRHKEKNNWNLSNACTTTHQNFHSFEIQRQTYRETDKQARGQVTKQIESKIDM